MKQASPRRSSQIPSSHQGPRLTISIFGGVRIAIDQVDLPLANRKGRALLAYLALCEQGTEQRERLAGLLWTDSTEGRARASLRQVLADIRTALNSCGCNALIARRTDVGLRTGSVDLDWDIILSEVDSGRVPELAFLRSRLADTAFAGYEDISPLFYEWILTFRGGCRDRLIFAFERNYNDDASPRLKRRLAAEAALRLDPTHEGACRRVMQLAAEDGELGPALRAYANLYGVLADELDMEPSEATQALAAAIKQGDFDRPMRHEQSPSSTPAVGSLPARRSFSAGAPVVAVLPLRSIGPDPVPIFFMEGMLDDTVRMLATLHEPVVISSNSTRGFRERDIDLRDVGRRLGAQYVLSGTIRAAGPRLRLSVELAQVADEVVLWCAAYDIGGPLHLDVQDDIALRIARTLVPRLRDAELRNSRGQHPGDLTAYHLILQARELVFQLEPVAFEQAGELLRRSIARDPGYAAARAASANWYSLRIGQGWSTDPVADMQALEAMARAAIAMDSGNGRALAMLAHNRTTQQREYEQALTLIDRALDASPNDAETLMWSSPTLAYIGRSHDAIERASRAIALSPEDPFIFRYEHFLSIAHYSAGDYEEAARWGMRSLRNNPHYTSNLRLTAAALVGLGRKTEVRPLIEKVIELQPDFRISPMIARQAFRDDATRDRFARQLAEAGLAL